ncbi:MAG: cadherin-like domain-containing protein, partial [Magnetovibrio sp.]|nr:cadherin-like domain-containing protein [Magnetovibrio sp.]
EIKDHMHQGLAGSETGLSGYWPLDEATNGVTPDLTSNASGGILGDVLGKAVTDFGTASEAGHAGIVQSDGKLVMVGKNGNFALTRYNTDGTPDVSFGTNGKVSTVIGSSSSGASDVVQQSDGKILVTGSSFSASTSNDFALIRYNVDGTLDTTFGTGGKTTVVMGNRSDSANSIALQTDGKAVVGGYTGIATSKVYFALSRHNTDGTLDTTFGASGKVVTAVGTGSAVMNDVVIQSDGKIVAVGYGLGSAGNNDFALVRYTANGTLDTTFGTAGTGKVLTAIGSGLDSAFKAVVQSDGKIIAVGYNVSTTGRDFALVRYNVDGTLDTSFGPNGTGKVTTSFGAGIDMASDVVLQPDGKIVVAGQSHNGTDYDYALSRYNVDGTLDTTFGTAGTGKVTTAVGSGADTGSSVILQSDGSIIVTGTSNNGTNNDFAAVHYNADGSLDPSYGGAVAGTDPLVVSLSGKALAFDGVDDFVDLGASGALSTGAGNFTWETWVRMDTLPTGTQTLINIGTNNIGTTGESGSIRVNSTGKVLFVVYNATGHPAGTSNIVDGKWHHVAVSYDSQATAGQEMKIIVDGAVETMAAPTTPNFTGGTASLGAVNTGALYMQGEMADARVWTSARSLTEIQSDMSNNSTGDMTQLAGYWPLADGTGTTIKDMSGNGLDGTLAGNTLGDAAWVNTLPSVYEAAIFAQEDQPYIDRIVATDADGNALSFSVLVGDEPAHGTVAFDATTPGHFTYTPTTNYNGTDTFTVSVNDGKGGVTTKVISVNVAPVNDAPTVTVGSAGTVDEGGSTVLTAAHLNATDVDNVAAELTYTVTTLPTNSSVKLNGVTLLANGTFTQADIIAGHVTLAHVPGTMALSDAFVFDLSDGVGGTVTGQTFSFSVNLNNVLTGTVGNDTLQGGAGNDQIDGGAGLDTAVFVGNMADFTIERSGADVIVTDNNATGFDEGVNTLRNVETLTFADGSVNLTVPENQANTFTPGEQGWSGVTHLNDGGYVVAWHSAAQGDTTLTAWHNFGVYAQRFNANGTKVGQEFQVNTTTADKQKYPTVTELTDGGYLIAWQSWSQDGSRYGSYAQRYNSDGTTNGTEFSLNITTSDDQKFPQLSALANGGFAAVWRGDGQEVGGSATSHGVILRVFDS